MTNTCVIGLQWGDEGKGKIIDILAKDYDIIVRYQVVVTPVTHLSLITKNMYFI